MFAVAFFGELVIKAALIRERVGGAWALYLFGIDGV